MNDRSLDAKEFLYEVGRQVQKTALMMRRHRVHKSHHTCECGRTPYRELPAFGRRCDVAGEQWDRMSEAVHTFLSPMGHGPGARAVGRAAVGSNGKHR